MAVIIGVGWLGLPVGDLSLSIFAHTDRVLHVMNMREKGVA